MQEWIWKSWKENLKESLTHRPTSLEPSLRLSMRFPPTPTKMHGAQIAGQKFFYVALHQIAKEIRTSVISPMGVLEPACLVRLVVQNVLLISLWIMNMEYKLARTNVNEGTKHHPLEQPRTTISKRHSQQHLKWLNPYERKSTATWNSTITA